jgi:hypothetical protein
VHAVKLLPGGVSDVDRSGHAHDREQRPSQDAIHFDTNLLSHSAFNAPLPKALINNNAARPRHASHGRPDASERLILAVAFYY